MTSNQALYFVGAAVLEIVSVAGTLIVEHYRQKHATIQYLERIERQLADIRAEIDQLWLLQDNRKLAKLSPTASSGISSDNSDSEFFELSSDEDPDQPSYSSLCSQKLKEVDDKLHVPNIKSLKEAIDQLTELSQDFPKNLELLCRTGEACQKLTLLADNNAAKWELIDKGLASCEVALELDSNCSEAHKWYGMLMGTRSELQPFTQKIKDATLFKKHIDLAFALNPDDGFLHYVLGRFSYETATMSWYERKAASLIFENLSTGSYEEALKYYLKAEQLLKDEFKDSKLGIAKCQIALGRHEDAVDFLTKAERCNRDSFDPKVNAEVNELLKKYSSLG